jgi:hypothetical protein
MAYVKTRKPLRGACLTYEDINVYYYCYRIIFVQRNIIYWDNFVFENWKVFKFVIFSQKK